MQRKWSARCRSLTMIAASAALAVLAVGAPPATAAPPTDTTTNVVLATTDEIRAMAAADGNEVVTFSAKPSGRAGAQYTITCYPRFTMPYGPDTAGSSVTVDSFVYCDDWVHSISLRPQIYRSNSLVASALYTVAYVNFVAGSVSTPCLPGSYFSAITAVMARYDAYPPVLQVSLRLPDTSFTCAGAPPPPPPAGVTVTSPGNQFNYVWDSVSLQMHASGGTGTYAWSATGLPTGLVLNSSTGLITGNVRTVGTYTTTLTATSGGQTGSTSFTWYVQSEPCPHC